LTSVEREGRKKCGQLLPRRDAAVDVLDCLRVGGAAVLLAGGVAFILLQAEAMGLQQFGLFFLDVRIDLPSK
jgi:hypothetical protein